MKLVYSKYSFEYVFKENEILIIDAENPVVFSDFVRDLSGQISGESGGWILSEDKELNISKRVCLIFDPFSLNCNERKIIAALHKQAEEDIIEFKSEEIATLNGKIVELLDDVSGDFPYGISFDLECDIAGLLKLYDLKVDMEGDSVTERIVNYITVTHRVLGIDIFAFVGLKQYLTPNQLREIYTFFQYEKINAIDFESHISQKTFFEKYWIIDNDFCIIYDEDRVN